MAKYRQLESLHDIKTGDTIVISGDTLRNEPFKVAKVKVSRIDGTEVIFDMKNNRFFNVGMYLSGKSWVKDCLILKD